MKIIYAGTPDFAVPALAALINSQHELVAVFTQPDRPAGRGKKLRASPVKQLALANDLPLFQPETLRDAAAGALITDLHADLMVVAAYGLMLPAVVLASPRFGCINVHASLLPRWRGAAPIQRAIQAGDAQTGITMMQMAAGLDTGDILLQRSIPISVEDTAASLHDHLAEMSPSLVLETLNRLAAGQLRAQQQDNTLATYAHKLEKKEALIDWSLPAIEIQRVVRAYNPWPVAHTSCSKGKLRIWESAVDVSTPGSSTPGEVIQEDLKRGLQVQTGAGALWLIRLQLPGGKPLVAREFLSARSLQGDVLGD